MKKEIITQEDFETNKVRCESDGGFILIEGWGIEAPCLHIIRDCYFAKIPHCFFRYKNWEVSYAVEGDYYIINNRSGRIIFEGKAIDMFLFEALA